MAIANSIIINGMSNHADTLCIIIGVAFNQFNLKTVANVTPKLYRCSQNIKKITSKPCIKSFEATKYQIYSTDYLLYSPPSSDEQARLPMAS